MRKRYESNQFVSVVMPVYNAKKYVKKAIDSILKQTHKDLELILIDDCGIDGSMDLIRNSFEDSRIKYISNTQNMGIAYSRNRGLKEAKGDYIALMDDDDIAPLNRLEIEVSFLQDHPEIDAVGGRYCMIDENDNITGYSEDTLQNPQFIKSCLMFYDPIGNGTMLFRNSVVKENNIRFKENCYGMEDYLFWVDFSQVGTISNVKDIMLFWRNVEGNETSRNVLERKTQREEKFSEIQKYAIRKNGFDLSEDDLKFLTSMLPEGKFYNIVTRKDTERLYKILKSIIRQSKDNDMKNYQEIISACKKQFSRRIECSSIWNI